MTDIETLKSQFFVQESDASLPSEPVPQTFEGCKVTPLIDASSYNSTLQDAFALIGTGATEESNANDFIFIAGWMFGFSGGFYHGASGSTGLEVDDPGTVSNTIDPYHLDTSITLLDVLKTKAQKGVDIRVLGWASVVLNSHYWLAQEIGTDANDMLGTNALTMQSIQDLRSEPKIGSKAILNTIGHSAGGAHTKMVVCGNATRTIAFTGGIDFVEDRQAHPFHPGSEIWHDVMVKIEGSATQALYDLFRLMWNENLTSTTSLRIFLFEGNYMPSHYRATMPSEAWPILPATPDVPSRTVATSTPGKHHVQSLRTIPQFNYSRLCCLPKMAPISAAPNGVFEIKTALRKAIAHAQTYIYIEDQALWSQEILHWIGDAIKANSDLKVILLTSGSNDPNPGPSGVFMQQAINHGLLENLITTQINQQVRFFKRLGELQIVPVQILAVDNHGVYSDVTLNNKTSRPYAQNELTGKHAQLQQDYRNFTVVGNYSAKIGDFLVINVLNDSSGPPSTNGDYDLYQYREVIVHSKTTLIDDTWAFIGSANIARRSLYTDLEHGIGMLDENDPPLLVKNYRQQLWADHFGETDLSLFADISEALHAWEASWGTSPGTVLTRPTSLIPITIPFSPELPFTSTLQDKYDMYDDLDSREPWGGFGGF